MKKFYESNSNRSNGNMQDIYEQNEFSRLMSLALDDELSSEEATSFEQMVFGETAILDHQAEWQLWQHLDVSFAEMPPAMPEANFVQRFEQRLAQKERRRRLWFGAVFAVMAVFVWGTVATAVVSLGPFVRQSVEPALASFAQSFGGFVSPIWLWIETVGSAFFTVASTAQVLTAVGLYALATGVVVVAWIGLLRRTTGTLSATASS